MVLVAFAVFDLVKHGLPSPPGWALWPRAGEDVPDLVKETL